MLALLAAAPSLYGRNADPGSLSTGTSWLFATLPTTERTLAYLSRVTAVQHFLPSLVDSHRTVYISCVPMFVIFPAVFFSDNVCLSYAHPSAKTPGEWAREGRSAAVVEVWARSV